MLPVAAAPSAAPAAEVLVSGAGAEALLASCGSGAASRLTCAGEPVSLQPDDGRSSCAFDGALYFSALRTRSLGRTLLRSPALPSTQALLCDAAPLLPPGCVVVADAQSGGRGRGANAWASPPGSLAFSAATSFAGQPRRLPLLQYVVSLALAHAVQDCAALALGRRGAAPPSPDDDDDRSGPAPSSLSSRSAHAPPAWVVDARIKWPNDLYGGGAKLAGVLCTAAFVAPGRPLAVALGVGLNVANEQPSGVCVDSLVRAAAAAPAGADAAAGGGGGGAVAAAGAPAPPPPVRRELLLAAFLNRYEGLEDEFFNSGAASAAAGDRLGPRLEGQYTAAWLHTGQVVTLQEAGGRRVVVRGLAPSGCLLAEDVESGGHGDGDGEGEGRWCELHPDGNSLDAFTGLVRRKLAAPQPQPPPQQQQLLQHQEQQTRWRQGAG